MFMRNVSRDNGSFCCMHRMFQNRLHAIHCTNQFWAGQCQGPFDWFIRSRKTSSGLTHKIKIKENKRILRTMLSVSARCLSILCFRALLLCNTLMNLHTPHQATQRSNIIIIEWDTLDISKIYSKLQSW